MTCILDSDRQPNFAPSEIAPHHSAASLQSGVSGDAILCKLRLELDKSKEHDSGLFFGEGHLKPTFIQGNKLLHAIIAGGKEALDLALQQPPLRDRKRKIPRDKLELIALELTAKPENEEQRKQCSSLACVLKVARNEGVAPEDFPAWLDENGVKKCRKRVAEERSSKNEPVIEAPMSTLPSAADDQPWLKISIGKGQDICDEGSIFVEMSSFHAAEALFKTRCFANEADAVLRSLADILEARCRISPRTTMPIGEIPGKEPDAGAVVRTSKGDRDAPSGATLTADDKGREKISHALSDAELRTAQLRSIEWVRYGPRESDS